MSRLPARRSTRKRKEPVRLTPGDTVSSDSGTHSTTESSTSSSSPKSRKRLPSKPQTPHRKLSAALARDPGTTVVDEFSVRCKRVITCAVGLAERYNRLLVAPMTSYTIGSIREQALKHSVYCDEVSEPGKSCVLCAEPIFGQCVRIESTRFTDFVIGLLHSRCYSIIRASLFIDYIEAFSRPLTGEDRTESTLRYIEESLCEAGDIIESAERPTTAV